MSEGKNAFVFPSLPAIFMRVDFAREWDLAVGATDRFRLPSARPFSWTHLPLCGLVALTPGPA
jgi:hypothetical protein